MLEEQLRRAVSDLCVYIHTEDIGGSETMSLAKLLALTPVQQVEFVKLRVAELMQVRRECADVRNSEEFVTAQKYEKSLQKLESEVRTHFSVQQQLRLHIEMLQNKFDEELREKAETVADLQRRVEALAADRGARFHGTDRVEAPSRLDLSADRSFDRISAINDLVSLRPDIEAERTKKLSRRVVKLEALVKRLKEAYLSKENTVKELESKLTAFSTARNTMTKGEFYDSTSRVRLAIRECADRSTSRERALTPIPNTLTTSRISSKALLRSNSNERKRMKIKLSVRKLEPDQRLRRP